LAEHAGLGAARGRQGLEAQPGQQAGRTTIPGIGDDEGAGCLVQGAELLGLVGLADTHGRFPYLLRPSHGRGFNLSTSMPSTAARLMPTVAEPSGAVPSA